MTLNFGSVKKSVKDIMNNGNKYLYDNKDPKSIKSFVGLVMLKDNKVVTNTIEHEGANTRFCAMSASGRNGYPSLSRKITAHEVKTLEGKAAFWFDYQ